MTRPSGLRNPPSASSGRRSATQRRVVASNRVARRLEAVSSGPNTRKLTGLAFTMSRRNAPRVRVASPMVLPGFGTLTA